MLAKGGGRGEAWVCACATAAGIKEGERLCARQSEQLLEQG